MIRNVALVGHSHSGKSALAEWMLYDENVITKRPRPGESVLDFDPAESARHSSVFSRETQRLIYDLCFDYTTALLLLFFVDFVRVPHAGRLIELTDTPWGDFQCDSNAALNGSDGAVIVASASDGLQTGTLTAFKYCRDNGIKCILALNKMDRPFVDVASLLNEFEAALGVKPIPLQVARGSDFEGVSHDFLISYKFHQHHHKLAHLYFLQVDPLFTYDSNGDLVRNDVDGTEEAWLQLEEAVAMTDDDLLTQYLDSSSLSTDQVLQGLRTAVKEHKLLPLVYTSAEKNLGVVELLDNIVSLLPDPVRAREDALDAACKNEQGKCGMKPGVEAGFAARVIHTSIDSFGSLSILRVISNGIDKEGKFKSIPSSVINLRTGDGVKIGLTTFLLQGKDRVPMQSGAQVLPDNVIALPKLPDSVHTNDILTVPEAVSEEEAEIVIEEASHVLTPLSRGTNDMPLMYCALVFTTMMAKKAKEK
jgi:elongation factor G